MSDKRKALKKKKTPEAAPVIVAGVATANTGTAVKGEARSQAAPQRGR